MTYVAESPLEVSLYDPDRSWRRVSGSTLVGAVALAFGLTAGAFVLDARFSAASGPDLADAGASTAPNLDKAPTPEVVASTQVEAPAPTPEVTVAASPYGVLLNPSFSSGVTGTFGQSDLLGRDFASTRPAAPRRSRRAQRHRADPARGTRGSKRHHTEGAARRSGANARCCASATASANPCACSGHRGGTGRRRAGPLATGARPQACRSGPATRAAAH